MSYKERLTILHESEINDLYGVPSLSLEEKRVSFALNDLEQDVIKSIRDRNHKCYAIVLLGYFKIKPIQLNLTYKVLQADLAFIADEYFSKFKAPRFSVSRMQKNAHLGVTREFENYCTLVCSKADLVMVKYFYTAPKTNINYSILKITFDSFSSKAAPCHHAWHRPF